MEAKSIPSRKPGRSATVSVPISVIVVVDVGALLGPPRGGASPRTREVSSIEV